MTDYTTSASEIASGAYVATLEDVSGALPNLTWGSPSVIQGGVGSNVTGFAFIYASDSAPIFRFSAAAIGVPESGVSMLGLVAAMVLVSRRCREAA